MGMSLTEDEVDKAGGEAFPWNGHGVGGMTLRDWFAGQALMGVLSNSKLDERVGENRVARSAYEIADAMLKARKK